MLAPPQANPRFKRRWVPAAARGPLLALLVGALFYVGLFVWCLVRFQAGEYMGVRDDAIVDRITRMFTHEIIVLQLQALGLYVGVGLLMGAVAWLHHQALGALRGRPPLTRRALIWRVTATVAAYHTFFLVRALVVTPQALADAFYLAGGIWRLLHRFLTDTVNPYALDALGETYLLLLAATSLGANRRRLSQFLRRSRWAFALWAALGMGLGVFMATALTRQPPPVHAQNLLIIAADSLRADRVNNTPANPQAPPALPRIRAFAQHAIQFDNAWSVMPRTFPSWVSMLTGQYPHTHGIRHMFPAPRLLSERRETLMTRLQAAGYRTVVISDFAGDIFSRLPLGFDEVRAPRFTLKSNVQLGALKLHYHLLPYLLTILGGRPRFPILKLWERIPDPSALTDEAIQWLQQRPDQPFALIVFYSGAHFPYAVPWPYYQRHAVDGYDGPSRYHKASWLADGGVPDPAEQRQIRGLYEGALRATDHAVGRLLDALQDLGLTASTHVVLTADHGENLYEEGFGIGHGDHLRGSNSLRIPLVLRPAGTPRSSPGTRVTTPVRSLDLGPTLLDYLGQPPLPNAAGRSLRPLAEGHDLTSAPPIFFETGLWFINPEAKVLTGKTITFAEGFGAYQFDPETFEIYFDERFDDDFLVAKHRAVLDGRWKLIYIPTRQRVLWELYDIVADPSERHELSKQQPKVTARLRAELETWMLSGPGMRRLGNYIVPRAGIANGAPHAPQP